MRTKLFYMLRVRLADGDPWFEPEEFQTRKQRDTAAAFARVLVGMRTHSYEERRAVADQAGTKGLRGNDRRERLAQK